MATHMEFQAEVAGGGKRA